MGEMTKERKRILRDNSQAIVDLAMARLDDVRLTDANVRHDLIQMQALARVLLGIATALEQDDSPPAIATGRTREER